MHVMEQTRISSSEKNFIALERSHTIVSSYPTIASKRIELIFHLMNLIGRDNVKELWKEKHDDYMKYLAIRRSQVAEVMVYEYGIKNKKLDPENIKSKPFERYMKAKRCLPMDGKMDKILLSLINQVDLEGINYSSELIHELKRKQLQASSGQQEQFEAVGRFGY